MGLFTKPGLDRDTQQQRSDASKIVKTPVKSSNSDSVDKSKTGTGKKKTLRGFNKLASRFRRLDEETVDSYEDSQSGEYVPPNDTRLMQMMLQNALKESNTPASESQSPRKRKQQPNTTPPRSSTKISLPKIGSGVKRYQNVDALMGFQRLDTAESHESEFSVEHIHIPVEVKKTESEEELSAKFQDLMIESKSSEKAISTAQTSSVRNIRQGQKLHHGADGLMSTTVFDNEGENRLTRSTKKKANISKKSANTQVTDIQALSWSDGLLDDEGNSVNVSYTTAHKSFPHKGKETSPKPKNPKNQGFQKLLDNDDDAGEKFGKKLSKKVKQKDLVKETAKSKELNQHFTQLPDDGGFDVETIIPDENQSPPISKQKLLKNDSQDSLISQADEEYVSADCETEFRQFVFDENFNRIEKVAIAKSDHGSNDFSDLVQAATKLTKKYTREFQQHEQFNQNDHKQVQDAAKRKLQQRSTENVQSKSDNGAVGMVVSDTWGDVMNDTRNQARPISTPPPKQRFNVNYMDATKLVQSVPAKWNSEHVSKNVRLAGPRKASNPQNIFRDSVDNSASPCRDYSGSQYSVSGSIPYSRVGTASVKSYSVVSTSETTTLTKPDYQSLHSNEDINQYPKTASQTRLWDYKNRSYPANLDARTDDLSINFKKERSIVAAKSTMSSSRSESNHMASFYDDDVEEIDPFKDYEYHEYHEPFKREFNDVFDDVDPFGIGSDPVTDSAWQVPSFDPFQNRALSSKKLLNSDNVEDPLIETIRQANDKNQRLTNEAPGIKPDPSPRITKQRMPREPTARFTSSPMPHSSDKTRSSATKESNRSKSGSKSREHEAYFEMNENQNKHDQPRRRDMSVYLKQNIDNLLEQGPRLDMTKNIDDQDESDDDMPFPDNAAEEPRPSLGPQKLAPKAVPTNAILGSMLFRQTQATHDVVPGNNKQTMNRMKNRVAPYSHSDHYKYGSQPMRNRRAEENGQYEDSDRLYSLKVPRAVHMDGAESTVSSVTEEASSVYHKTFQPAWTKQAQSILNSYNAQRSGISLNDRVYQVTQKMSRLEKEHANMFTSEF